MRQYHVEIEGYSVAYFDCIAAFKAPYRWASGKGGDHMHFVDLLDIHASKKHVSAPPLTEVQRYGASNTVMRSKYAAQQPSISTWDCHICTVWGTYMTTLVRWFMHHRGASLSEQCIICWFNTTWHECGKQNFIRYRWSYLLTNCSHFSGQGSYCGYRTKPQTKVMSWIYLSAWRLWAGFMALTWSKLNYRA